MIDQHDLETYGYDKSVDSGANFYGETTISRSLKQLTDNISNALHALASWNMLHYTGHFIDVDPEMMERINTTHEKTKQALRAFKMDVRETPNPTEEDAD